LRRKLDWIVAH